MLDTRRFFVKRAIETAGGLIAAAALPLRASADCASQTKLMGFSASLRNGILTRYLEIPDWTLANCELKNAQVAIVQGNATLSAQVCTHFTHTKDVWHFRLQIISANPVPTSPQVFFDQTFDGPQMSEQDNPLFHQWNVNFRVDQAVDLSHALARVTSCC